MSKTLTGRKTKINHIREYFSENDSSLKKIYNLFGESGIGKSYICRYLYDDENFATGYLKHIIDFNSQTTRSMINLIEFVAESILIERNAYKKTYELLDKYYKSVDSSKPVFFRDLFDSFIEETNKIAQDTPILIILDTVEVVCNSAEWEKIKRFIFETSNNVCFLCSGIDSLDFSERVAVKGELLGFDSTEISDYFSIRVPKLRKELKKRSSFLPEKIQRFTKNGHPILCSLLADWLIEFPSQVNYVLDNTREISERMIISEWFKKNPQDDTSQVSEVLKLLAYFTKRMNPYILSKLLDLDDSTSSSLIKKIGNYSFVKYFPEDENIILHDAVVELIREYNKISDVSPYYHKIVAIYKTLILESRTEISSTVSSYLQIELIYYHMRFTDVESAIEFYEQEFLFCLDTFDFSMCNILLAMICDNPFFSNESRWAFSYQVAKADLLLAEFQPQEAILLYEKLKSNECYSLPQYKAKADEIYARSIMNPCTVPKLKPATAIDIFIACISIYEKEEDASFRLRLVRSWLFLGMAYVRIGNSEKANHAFENAEEHSTTNLQSIAILLEKSKMLRLQQNVNASLTPLVKCARYFDDFKINKGKYFYYLGNIMRDLNEFEEAEKIYKDALDELVYGIDDFTLAELYFDYSWMEYLRSEHVNFDKVYDLLEKGWKLVKSKKFGVEYSEYFHIKYEIERDQGNLDKAHEYLDVALDYSKEYSNIYMLLDCLNHKVQQAFIERDYDQIPIILEEMDEVEKTGCGIKVFRGRAKLVQGDVYYQQRKFEEAFIEWKDGFCIVALYGNSRTNVELFDDLFRNKAYGELSRKEKMKSIISRLSKPTKSQLKRYWTRMRVTEQFDYFIDELYEK